MADTMTASLEAASSSRKMTAGSEVRALYEEFTFPLRGNHHDFVARYVLPYVRGNPKNVLEAGCGTGNSAIVLARNLRESRFLGVDFSENSLRHARALADKENVGNIAFRFHDLMQPIEFAESKYDLIVSLGVVHHTPDPALVLRNLRNVITNGGQFILAVYGKFGRAEIEMRRELVNLLRDRTGSSNRDLMALTSKLLAEPVLNENTFQKVGPSRSIRSLLKSPQRLVAGVRRRLRRALRIERNSGIPADIGIADQYLHPVVCDWTAAKWIHVAQEEGFVLNECVFDPAANGICIPRNALALIHDPGLRTILSRLGLREQYAVLELIFRPSIHVFSFNATAA